MKDVIAIIMAGGKGERLQPLTTDRSKPAVPFGGIYRIIDITLSNCVNSGAYRIIVLPQYKSQSLVDHLEAGWNIFSGALGHYLRIAPPQMRTGLDWYRGTADSVRQNLYLIQREQPKHVLILSGDHVYKMDYSLFLEYHRENDADVTVSVIEMEKELSPSYGVVEVEPDNRVRGFQEKPETPTTIPGDSAHFYASMGVYMFNTEVLYQALSDQETMDFGQHIMPALVEKGLKVYAYPYKQKNRIEDFIYVTRADGIRELTFVTCTRDSSYWRDVGSLDAYWNANMDLTGVDPFFNLYGKKWPIRTYQDQSPPVKTVYASEIPEHYHVGKALDSLVSHGCIISGGTVRSSVLSRNVFVHSHSKVEESVIMDNVEIGRYCKIKKAIIDKHNIIPPGTLIGYDPEEDRKRFTVTPRGIVVVAKGQFA
jgi:glucose-1-phosphate adenylyltransferase